MLRWTVANLAPALAPVLAVTAMLAAPPVGAQEPTAEPAGRIADQSLLVKLQPWTLGFDSAEVKAGRISIRIENPSNIPHGFRLQGPDTDWQTEQLILPEEARTIAVDLAPGTYTLTCPVDDHAGKGMKARLTVTK